MKPKKVMVATFLNPINLQTEFTKWPHHITIVPWFECEDLEKLYREITAIAKNIQPIPYQIGNIAYFGRSKNLKVSLIKANPNLLQLHTNVLKIARNHDPKMKTQNLGENYKPHITHKDPPYPEENAKHTINGLYIIESTSEKHKTRKIINKFTL